MFQQFALKAASMGAVLLSCGAKAKDSHYLLVMIHQPLGGARQATDIKYEKEILTLKEKLNKILSETTNQSIKKIQADTERDYFMNAQEAVKYGLVDEILKNRK